MSKIIKKGQEKIIKGVNKAVDAVKVTLGPAGHSIAITADFDVVDASRDGANILKSISFKDKEENIGAQLVKKAAVLTEAQAGDSTTTTSILINELVVKGQKAVQTGSNVNEIKSGMLKAGNWMNDYIKNNSILVNGDLEKIKKVATISANNDPNVGSLVVECMEKVGENGVITSELSSGLSTEIKVTQGMKLNRGWSSPQYVTNPNEGICELIDPYVLVVGEKISSVSQIYRALQLIVEKGGAKPFIIVCDDMDEVVNSTIAINTLNGAFRACVIKGVDFGDARKNLMEDIAIACGATFICPENNISIEDIELKHLGVAKKIIVSRDSTVILEGQGDKGQIDERIEVLKNQLQLPTVTSYDRSKFESRIANLAGGIAVIKVGAASEVEARNKKATIDDSILASKSAIEEGVSVGSGYVYLKGSVSMMKDNKFLKTLTEDELEGVKIVANSLPIIMRTVVYNCGCSPDIVIDNVIKSKKTNFGFNAKTKEYCNLLDSGVLDSTKAVRVALENSISTASTILLIAGSIIEEDEAEDTNNITLKIK